MSNEIEAKLEPNRYEESKELLISGLRQHYTPESSTQIPGLWTKLDPDFGQLPNQVNKVAYGIVFAMKDGIEGFDYLAGAEVSELPPVDSDKWQSTTLPAQKYAVFAHTGHISKLRETIHNIWQNWRIPTDHKIPGEIDMIERYGEDFDAKTGYGTLELLVPIQA